MRFLETSYDLWEESITMQNCVDQFASKCLKTNARLASVTHGDRRVATAMFDWNGNELKLTQIAGRANRPVSEVMAKRLSVLTVPGGQAYDKKPLGKNHIGGRNLSYVRPPELPENQTQHREKAFATNERKTVSMTATVTNTGGYLREVEISPVGAVANTFHMEFRSRLLSAKNPNQSQKNFSLTLDRDGLVELRELVERALLQAD